MCQKIMLAHSDKPNLSKVIFCLVLSHFMYKLDIISAKKFLKTVDFKRKCEIKLGLFFVTDMTIAKTFWQKLYKNIFIWVD